MILAGDANEPTIRELAGLLEPGDPVVDGGNSDFGDSMRRARGFQRT
jgi:6-phosphogluconate dehydrogenase